MKLRIISLSVGGEVALREFFSEISRKKSFKEKMVLSAAKALGSVKAKEFKEDPYSLTVSFSAWKRIPKHLITVSQVLPLVQEHWFPGLVYDGDYKVRIV